MKNIIITIVLLLCVSFAWSQQTKTISYYTCVMNPEVHKAKPGNCPICGMALYKKTVTVKVIKTAIKKKSIAIVKDTLNAMDDAKDMQLDSTMEIIDRTDNMDAKYR